MSREALEWAWTAPDLDPSSVLVLVALADHYNDRTGQCFPSLNRLAERTRLDRRTVQRVLAKLVDRGLIERMTGNGRKSTSYHLVIHSDAEVIQLRGGTTPPQGRRGRPVEVAPRRPNYQEQEYNPDDPRGTFLPGTGWVAER